MIVCLCEGIRESDIKEAVKSGATELRELGRHCGAGSGCGSCHAELSMLIQSYSKKAAHSEPALPTVSTPHRKSE